MTIYAYSLWNFSKGLFSPRKFIEMERADQAMHIAFINELAEQREKEARKLEK